MLQEPPAPITEQASEAALRSSFALAAQYILLSYVLQPSKEVYSKSLQVIKQLLPLPNLRAGRLLAVNLQHLDSVPEHWSLTSFVLNETGFRSVLPLQQPKGKPVSQQAHIEESEADSGIEPQQQQVSEEDPQMPAGYQIELSDIACVKPCNDPSLPPGYAFWVSLRNRTQGLYFVAESSEDAEGWIDALHMTCYAAKQGRMQMLHHALGSGSDAQISSAAA